MGAGREGQAASAFHLPIGSYVRGLAKTWLSPVRNGNSVFSRDLILKEVSELNGIVGLLVSPVCKRRF